jgi:chorismate mutase
MILKGRNIFLIAGPCSAESREQMLQTASALMLKVQPDVIRAGIWKARTRMNTFEGVGKEGLKWLREIKANFGVPVATEVLKPEHAELCIEAGIDYIWLGARTVVNPFMVQEICSALRGSDLKIMVKNPVNPDIKLWIGAIERIFDTGATSVTAIHRGFSTYYNSPYRNMPLWEIPNELRRIFPELPVICDPSHICGKTQCIQEIVQQALDLEMSGLMIESHANPFMAKSDKDQQLTPDQLYDLLHCIVVRNRCESLEQKLKNLRIDIDFIDNQLLEFLSRRLRIIEEIGRFKKTHHITILQSERSKHIFSDRMKKGNSLNIHPEFLKTILKAIHNEAIRIQLDIMKPDSEGSNTD